MKTGCSLNRDHYRLNVLKVPELNNSKRLVRVDQVLSLMLIGVAGGNRKGIWHSVGLLLFIWLAGGRIQDSQICHFSLQIVLI